ncbi:MAG: CBS domain-containing protein [Alphaproteobacteria bacterium]|nr:CBS domain-containing protein [Alphaproteobacteria bacterium]MCB9695197.1 CBS domain-containing protein [Alphaproteobacteria bacterium]
MTTLGENVTTTTALVAPWESMARCAGLMVALKRRHLVVVDEGDRPLGLVSDLDVFRQGTLVGAGDWAATPQGKARAEDILLPIDVIGLEHDPLDQALDRLADSVQDVIVCVDAQGRLVGLLSEHDAMGIVSRQMPERLPLSFLASHQVSTVGRFEPAVDALTTMLTERRRHLVVLDEAGKVHGVVSLRDLFANGVADGERRMVDEVMVGESVHVARADHSIRRAATEMARHQIGCLPVVDDDGRCIEVITRTDILRAYAAWLREHVAVRVASEQR